VTDTTTTVQTAPMTADTTTTVYLSDRSPVRVDCADWPEISYSSVYSGPHEAQANEVARLSVRRHDDGRTLVYGCRGRGPGGCPITYHSARAGYLLTRGEDVVRAIRRVVGALSEGTYHLDAGDMRWLAGGAISDLPPEDL